MVPGPVAVIYRNVSLGELIIIGWPIVKPEVLPPVMIVETPLWAGAVSTLAPGPAMNANGGLLPSRQVSFALTTPSLSASAVGELSHAGVGGPRQIVWAA